MQSFLTLLRRSYIGQSLLFLLISFMILPPLQAQQQRRGVFLQDEVSQDSSGGFGPLDTSGMEDEFEGNGLRGRRSQQHTQSSSTLLYQVHVLGEVKRPGTYRISPSMRVTDALRLAGGIEDRGSERFAELRKPGHRHGKILDLFSYKTLGNIAENPYLRDNDTIFIPLKKRAVEIEGPIRRPGVYELKNERNLYDLVKLAGGFSVGASKEHGMKVVRYSGNEEKEISEVNTTPQDMQGFILQDGDVVVVQHKFLTKHTFDYNLRKLPNDNIFYPAMEDKVFVIGGVKRPGPLPFNQYYTLRQYMTLAGGTTVMAKKGKIRVITADGRSIKTPKGMYDGIINPGDTIVIPERAVPPQFYLNFVASLASLGLSGVALFTR